MHTTTKAEGRMSIVGIIQQAINRFAERRAERREQKAEKQRRAEWAARVERANWLHQTSLAYERSQPIEIQVRRAREEAAHIAAIVAGEQERSRREAELHQEIMREEAEFLKRWAAEGYWQADEDGTPPEFYSSDLRAAGYEEAFLREHPEEAMADCQDNDGGWRQTCEAAGEFYDPDPGIVAEHIINSSDGDEEITDRLTAVGLR